MLECVEALIGTILSWYIYDRQQKTFYKYENIGKANRKIEKNKHLLEKIK